jgi:ABC-2 type transport system permease protein
MEIVARCNPLTYAIEAMRVLVLEGWETSLLWSFGALGAIAFGCLGLGAYQFHEQTADRLSDASS